MGNSHAPMQGIGSAVEGVRVSVVGHEEEAVTTGSGGQFVLPAHAADGQQAQLHAEKAHTNPSRGLFSCHADSRAALRGPIAAPPRSAVHRCRFNCSASGSTYSAARATRSAARSTCSALTTRFSSTERRSGPSCTPQVALRPGSGVHLGLLIPRMIYVTVATNRLHIIRRDV